MLNFSLFWRFLYRVIEPINTFILFAQMLIVAIKRIFNINITKRIKFYFMAIVLLDSLSRYFLGLSSVEVILLLYSTGRLHCRLFCYFRRVASLLYRSPVHYCSDVHLTLIPSTPLTVNCHQTYPTDLAHCCIQTFTITLK